jgi:hypothetical protein
MCFLLQNHREAGRHEITAVIHAPDSDTVLVLVSFELRLFVGYDKLCSRSLRGPKLSAIKEGSAPEE